MILNGTVILPEQPLMKDISQDMHAYTNGSYAALINITVKASTGEIIFKLLYEDTMREATLVFYKDGAWINNVWRYVNFNEQEVSEEFYCWATGKSKKLDGRYRFCRTLNGGSFDFPSGFETVGVANTLHTEAVTFRSNGKTYDSFSISAYIVELTISKAWVISFDGFEPIYDGYYNADGSYGDGSRYGNLYWKDQAYRTVEFDNQYVTDEFYEFIMANTVPSALAINTFTLIDIADAIRAKKGYDRDIPVSMLAEEIRNL